MAMWSRVFDLLQKLCVVHAVMHVDLCIWSWSRRWPTGAAVTVCDMLCDVCDLVM